MPKYAIGTVTTYPNPAEWEIVTSIPAPVAVEWARLKAPKAPVGPPQIAPGGMRDKTSEMVVVTKSATYDGVWLTRGWLNKLLVVVGNNGIKATAIYLADDTFYILTASVR